MEVIDSPAIKEEAKPKRLSVLAPQRKSLAEAGRQDWVVNAEAGTTPDEIIRPEYWSLVSTEFQPFDRIDVREEAGEWMAELVVLEVARTWTRVRLLHFYAFAGEDLPKTPEALYVVEYKGPQLKHCVIRKSDGMKLQSGISTKLEAEQWMQNYEARVS